MKSLLFFAALTLSFLGAVLVQADGCDQYLSCQTCIGKHSGNASCGWCSTPVVGPVVKPGQQCAGVVPGKPSGFICKNIFSTKSCTPGWLCSKATGTCHLGPPGSGKSKQDCEDNCTVDLHVYTCNNKTHQCEIAKSGTPGATSLLVCDQHCHPTATATGSPSSHHPSPPPTTSTPLFACNYSSGECVASTPGHGSSLQVCKQNCKHGGGFRCDTFTKKCVACPDTIKCPSMEQCQAECNPTSAPNPPPSFKLGLYRGLMIDQSYQTGVVYVDVTETQFTMVQMKADKVVSYLQGSPRHIPPSATNEHKNIMIVDITAPAKYAGKKLSSIADQGGLNLPEVEFITFAYATELDAPAPEHIMAAMTSGGKSHVLGLSKCLTPECKFTLPALPKFDDVDLLPLHSFKSLEVVDPCTQYGSSCKTCLSHAGCGFCNTPVIYQNHQAGSRCAGERSVEPWVCESYYNQLSCPKLYSCSNTTHTCHESPSGTQTQEQCESACKLPPTPAPSVKKLYQCNTTTKQCHVCRPSATNPCPASAATEAACTALCQHHHHGPPSNLVGMWRGYYINADYKDNEVDISFTNSSATFYEAGKQVGTANVSHFGGDVMKFEFHTGKYKGFSRSMYFAQAPEVPNGLYLAIDAVMGKLDGPIPGSFPEAMSNPDMRELVFFVCQSAACKFHAP